MDICLAVDSLIKVKEHSAVQLDTILEDQAVEHVRRTALGVERQQHVQVSCNALHINPRKTDLFFLML